MRPCSALVFAAGLACCSDEDRPCTNVGCSDGVTIDLGSRASLGAPGNLNAHVCIDDVCNDAILTSGGCETEGAGRDEPPPLTFLCASPSDLKIQASSSSPIGPGSHTISVSVNNAAGAILLMGSQTLGLSGARPNGPGCEPICYQGDVSFKP